MNIFLNTTYFKERPLIEEFLQSLKSESLLHESAVEIEIELFDNILEILTTNDGTLSPILFNYYQIEEVLKLSIDKIQSSNFKTVSSLLWDDFNLIEKREILKTSTRFRGKSFKEDRTLDGIKVRERIDVNFIADTEILSKKYDVSDRGIDLNGAFCLVEILSGGHVKNLEKIELHLRRDDLAGDLSCSAQRLLDVLKVKRTHQHIHIVSKLPVDELKNDPDGKVMELADNFRRVNLVSEMRAIVLREGTIYRKDYKDSHNFFKYLNQEIFEGVIDYLYNISNDKFSAIGDSLKKGWVGYRGHDKYDGDEILHGLEHRDIKPGDNLKEVRDFLNASSYFLENYSKNRTPKRVVDWIESIKVFGTPKEYMLKSMYQRSFENLFKDMDESLNEIVNSNLLGKLKSVIIHEKVGKFDYHKNYQIKLLLQNFEFDPLVYNDKEFLALILWTQQDALNKISKGANPLAVVRNFLIDSTIFERFNLSISY